MCCRELVYHPPTSSRSSGTSSECYAELECLFTEASISITLTTIAGDFNIHFDDVTKSEPLRYLLNAFSLLQHVNSPTHKTGHTLDLVISSRNDNLVSSVVVYRDLISDYHSIALTLNTLKPSIETSVIAKRNFRNMDAAAFCDNIKSTCSTMCALVDGQHVDDLVLTYNTCLSDCLDKHAPWRNVRINSNSPHPW